MKITKIDIKNFRAFYGDYSIDLCKSGKNLLVYGENGSGKSSLFFALKLFLNSHVNNYNFLDYCNIFVETTDGGYLKLSLRENEYSKLITYEWSNTTKETNDILILDAAKTSGFVDYKGLLKTYFLTPEGNRVNIFDILINNLLAHSINSYTQTSFTEDWDKINTSIPKRNTALPSVMRYTGLKYKYF
jgi:AAA15 family ATPase/GTPase